MYSVEFLRNPYFGLQKFQWFITHLMGLCGLRKILETSFFWNMKYFVDYTMFLLDYTDYKYYICTSTSNNSLMPIKNTPSHILFPFSISLHHIAKLLSCSINSSSILGYNKLKLTLNLKHMYK